MKRRRRPGRATYNVDGSKRAMGSPTATDTYRAVSPVIGVVLMIVLTIVLAAMLATVALSFEDRLVAPQWNTDADNPWAENPLFGPENPIAGAEDVRYRVYFEVEENATAGPLNTITISVDTDEDDMFTGTTGESLETFDVIRTNGTVVDLTPSEKWTASENTLTIKPEKGKTDVGEAGEVVEIIFGGVDNPADPGIYEVTVSIDQGNVADQQGELEIIAA